jgi:hypothetical protein
MDVDGMALAPIWLSEVASSGATLLSLLCNSANAREAAHNPLVPELQRSAPSKSQRVPDWRRVDRSEIERRRKMGMPHHRGTRELGRLDLER